MPDSISPLFIRTVHFIHNHFLAQIIHYPRNARSSFWRIGQNATATLLMLTRIIRDPWGSLRGLRNRKATRERSQLLYTPSLTLRLKMKPRRIRVKDRKKIAKQNHTKQLTPPFGTAGK
jgi:hypothetical protein